MSLLAELGVTNVAEVDLNEVDKKMSAGDVPPEGIHHAVLQTVGPIPNCEGRGWKMTFEILAGAGKGAVVEEALWKPKGDDAKKDATTKNRVLMFMHRLGLLKKVTGPDGKEVTQEIAGKHDFCDCLGTTTFIEIQHVDEEYTKNDQKRTIKKAKLTFGGLLAADDKKVKEAIAAGKLVVASGAAVTAAASRSAGQPAGGKKDDFGDL